MEDIRDLVEKAASGRWIAGREIEDALALAKKCNKRKIGTQINYMGLSLRKEEDVFDAIVNNLALMREIKKNRVKASITVKSVQIGLLIDKKFMNDNYKNIVQIAKKNNIFVWLDIVEAKYLTDSIKLYDTMVKSGNTGLSVQAYLKRSRKDLRYLMKKGAVIRLVKGAYTDKPSITYKGYDDITANYLYLMKELFAHSKKKFVIASHDPKVIDKAERLEDEYPDADVTYAMLNGIKNRYALSLAESGKKVELYIPFGKRWVEFGYNRLKYPHNLMMVTRSLFESQKI